MTESAALAYEIAGRQIVVLSILVMYLGYFATQIVFRMVGRDYGAAMVVDGFFGPGLEQRQWPLPAWTRSPKSTAHL